MILPWTGQIEYPAWLGRWDLSRREAQAATHTGLAVGLGERIRGQARAGTHSTLSAPMLHEEMYRPGADT